MNFDFSRPVRPIDDEKKTELVSFRAGTRFKEDLQAIAQAKGVDLAVLVHEYAIKGFLEDYKSIALYELNGKKTLKELLQRQ